MKMPNSLSLPSKSEGKKRTEITNCYNTEEQGRYGRKEEGEKGFTEKVIF